jgi:hypothetical protein
LGYIWTEESKQKLIGRHIPEEVCNKISLTLKGRKHTKEALQNMIKAQNKEDVKLKQKLSHIGYKHTEEAKLKMSKALKGKYVGINNSHYGKSQPESFILKMSGENHPNWRGGISHEEYPFEWNHKLKEKIRERDGYLCQICHIGQNGHRLPVHHIDYNKFNLSFNNLISLCTSCHAKTDFNREYYTEYFTNLLKG